MAVVTYDFAGGFPTGPLTNGAGSWSDMTETGGLGRFASGSGVWSGFRFDNAAEGGTDIGPTQYAKCQIKTVAANSNFKDVMPAVRWQSGANGDCYVLDADVKNALSAWYVCDDNGASLSFTGIGSSVSTAWADEDIVEGRAGVGGTYTLKGYRNGAEVISRDDTSQTYATGQPGITGGNLTAADVEVDSAEGGDVPFAPPPYQSPMRAALRR
jgi:hypothetical protein